MKKIKIKSGSSIDNYKSYGALKYHVEDFLTQSTQYAKQLQNTTIWMINSTATGGGVAEMLPSQIRLLRAIGVKIEWLVLDATDQHFFDLTKRIHNAIHGSGSGDFSDDDRTIYEKVNENNIPDALTFIQDGDIVVIHDPQPMPLGRLIKENRKVKLIWRCHIGLDESNAITQNVWSFLSKYFEDYDQFIFSLKEYVPKVLEKKTTIITPAIDPLSHKNRHLHTQKCIGILQQSGILPPNEWSLYPNFEHPVRRVMKDGTFDGVNAHNNLDIIYKPIITEISRWDRLKGFKELLDAFVMMKKHNENKNDKDSIEYKRIQQVCLILGGPDPKFVSDDPEGLEVLNELVEIYKKVAENLQDSIAILLLPMNNAKENALIVNALQNCSSIVVQNSIQEGFGLTATEAMWKKTPVLVSGATGLVRQVVHNETGMINENPKNIEKLALMMENMLNSPKKRDEWSFHAQIRVIENFTLFTQLFDWLQVFAKVSKR